MGTGGVGDLLGGGGFGNFDPTTGAGVDPMSAMLMGGNPMDPFGFGAQSAGFGQSSFDPFGDFGAFTGDPTGSAQAQNAIAGPQGSQAPGQSAEGGTASGGEGAGAGVGRGTPPLPRPDPRGYPPPPPTPVQTIPYRALQPGGAAIEQGPTGLTADDTPATFNQRFNAAYPYLDPNTPASATTPNQPAAGPTAPTGWTPSPDQTPGISNVPGVGAVNVPSEGGQGAGAGAPRNTTIANMPPAGIGDVNTGASSGPQAYNLSPANAPPPVGRFTPSPATDSATEATTNPPTPDAASPSAGTGATTTSDGTTTGHSTGQPMTNYPGGIGKIVQDFIRMMTGGGPSALSQIVRDMIGLGGMGVAGSGQGNWVNPATYNALWHQYFNTHGRPPPGPTPQEYSRLHGGSSAGGTPRPDNPNLRPKEGSPAPGEDVGDPSDPDAAAQRAIQGSPAMRRTIEGDQGPGAVQTPSPSGGYSTTDPKASPTPWLNNRTGDRVIQPNPFGARAGATPGGAQGAIQTTLQNSGLTPNAVGGMMLNMESESGGRNIGGSAGEMGRFQMRGDKLREFRQWAAANGKQTSDPSAEAQFVVHWLQAHQPGTLARMNAAGSKGQAAIIFLREFERPAAINVRNRTRQYMNQ